MKRPQGELPNETSPTRDPSDPRPARALESVPAAGLATPAVRPQSNGGASETRSAGERLRPLATGVRATVVLAPEDLELLQGEKFRRRMAAGGRLRGSAGDFSSLVREAIRKTYGKP